MLKIILSGCNGYMGQVVTALVKEDPSITIIAGIDTDIRKLGNYPVFTDINDFNDEISKIKTDLTQSESFSKIPFNISLFFI